MNTAGIYQAGLIKRSRRTKQRVETLDEQIIEVLREDNPQSVRHVFYRMTDPRLAEPVEKSDRGYAQVQSRCTILRRTGKIPYEWLADQSRRGHFVYTYQDSADFIRSIAGAYRQDLWRHSDYRCEVWCESRSIAAVMQGDCNDLAVDLYPCGGFPSLSFVHEAASLHNSLGDERPLCVFYIGDYDPAGVLIDKKLETELRLHLDKSIPLFFERVGINEDQIDEFDLPMKPRKASDKRSPQVFAAVEAESLPAGILRKILRERIEGLLPEHALQVTKQAEQSEREGLIALARRMERTQ
jgi:hypothetical protein